MTRKLALACLLGVFSVVCAVPQTVGAGAPPAEEKPGPVAPQPPDETAPPEEDETLKPRTYAFDPLEAERNINVGKFYMHKGTSSGYRAAAGRFEDATKYNPNSAEAFFRLGEAEEKLKNKERAEEAFKRVVKVAPDSKLAKEAQRKLARRG